MTLVRGHGYELSATCGDTKTVKIHVIRPEFVYLHFISGEGGEAYHIHDKTDTWQRDPPLSDKNDPACFKMGCKTAVEVKFWHPTRKLKFDTEVEVRGDVHWLDEYITGEDYGRDKMTFAHDSQYMVGGEGQPVYSEETTVSYIDYDHDTDIAWYYQVKSPAGTDEWVDTGSSHNLVYYIILDEPQAPMAAPWVEVLELATDWARCETDEAGVVDAITVSAYNDFGKDYDGDRTHSADQNMDLTNLLAHDWADCRDMSAVVHVFTRAIGGTDTLVRRIDAAPPPDLITTKPIDPIGPDGWSTMSWGFHQVAHYGNVYDACVRVNQADPRIPCNEPINGSYKNDLWLRGPWIVRAPFPYVDVD